MKRNEKSNSVAGIKILQLFVVIAIMITAGIGFSGKVASATSEDDCIVLEACGYEEEDKKYNVGEYEIVISYEEMNIYKEGDLLNTVPYFAWNLGWIIDNKLYYTDRLDIYYFDFYTETMHEFMTIEPVKALSYEDWEPNVTKIILYQKPYLYLKIEQNSLYDYSLIRIDLNKKTQENIIEEAETIIRNLGVYNNYMYCAYPTHDGGYYNGFARISLGEYAKEERIEDNTSEVFMYENKIYYLRKNGNMNSVLKYYDVTSGTKNTLKTWKNHNIGIKKIKNGIIYLYGLQTNQEMQYNIKTGEVKNVKYVKPLKGIKVTHKTIYSNKKSTMKDVCKISWDKSFTGKIEISYGTSNYRTDHYYGNNTKRVKATKKKNYCYLNLTSGKKYYIVVRAYKGKEGSEIYSVDSKRFAFNSRAITSMDENKQPCWNYIKRGKNLYYSCKENGKYYIYKRNTKTGKQKIIKKSKKKMYLLNATNRYFYYTNDLSSRVNLYAYDVKKKKKKKMNPKGIYSLGDSVIGNGKIVFVQCIEADGEMGNIYCFNLDGSNRKKIGKGYNPFINKNHIYWRQIKFGSNDMVYDRYCKSDMNGKNKKAVTKWILETENFKIAEKVDWDWKKTYLKIAKIKKWKK